MAGDSGPSTKTGLAKHFDTQTMLGRKNCTLASFAFYLAVFIAFKLKPSKKE